MTYLKRILKFQMFNWLGAVIYFAVLWFFHGKLHIHLLLVSAMGMELAIIHNFTWHYFITWNDRISYNFKDYFRRLLQYNFLTATVDLTLNLIVLSLLTEYFGIHYILSSLGAGLIAPFFKFVLNEIIIFNKKDRVPLLVETPNNIILPDQPKSISE